MKATRIVLIALGFALAGSAMAAPDALPIRFDRLSVEEGLSQATVLALHQDSRGYLWAATEDGLNRYDGTGFEVFRHDPKDPASLPGTFVWSMAEDSRGTLWIATEDGGLARFDADSDTFARVDAIPDRTLRAVLVDGRDGLWVGTRESGIWYLAEGQEARHFTVENGGLQDDHVYALHTDRAGRVWAGTDAGVYVFDRAEERFTRISSPESQSPLSGQRVRTITDDARGRIWIGTYASGLNLLDPNSGDVVSFRHDPTRDDSLAHDRVRSLTFDEAGRLWVGTSAGLELLVDEAGQRFAHYRNDEGDADSLRDNHVMALLQDRGGIFWVGTRFGGLHKWNPRTWQFGHHRSAASPLEGGTRVTSFVQDGEGYVWVAEFGVGVSVLDAEGRLVRRFEHDPADPETISSNRVTALASDSQGRVWVGTLDGGLNRVDLASGAVIRYPHAVQDGRGTSASGISSIIENRSGSIWIGTFGGGVNRLDPRTGRFQVFRHDPEVETSLGNDRVTTLSETPLGQIWVGTHGGGLFLLDPLTGHGKNFTQERGDASSLPSNLVYATHVDRKGRLWVGSNAGLSLVNLHTPAEASFVSFRERHGLPNAVVYAIEEDPQGGLWLSTNKGLARFDSAARSFECYDKRDGLQGNEFNFGASYRDAAGRLYFGGLEGFNVFDAASLEKSPAAPLVALRAVERDHEPIDETPASLEKIELGHRDRSLKLRFAALDFTDPARNVIEYRLAGFDEDWVDAGASGIVSYTNLDAGTYTLHVKARNADMTWSEEPYAIDVQVKAPPWRTPWAYGGYTLGVFGCLFGFVRLQERKVQREEERSRELEAKVRKRTQDLAERSKELEQVNRRLAKASITDSLTGFANRRFLVDYVNKEIALVQRRYSAAEEGTLTREAFDLAFLMVDLDEFKSINDTFGHNAGDEVLRELNTVLGEACRDSDIVIRWGGDEFLIVARDLDVRNLSSLAERIRTSIANHPFSVGDGQFVRATCSIGYACYPFIPGDLESLTWEQVLSVSDRALYMAKHSGRNAWVGLEATPESDGDIVLSRLRDDLHGLAEDGQIKVHTSLAVDQRPIAWEQEDK